jgi:glucoamylase
MVAGQRILVAQKNNTWLALGATVGLARGACGFVGVNDGWKDLSENFTLDWTYDCAQDGNIALTGEMDLRRGTEFTLGIAFGNSFHNAVTTLFQSLGISFDEHLFALDARLEHCRVNLRGRNDARARR